MRKLSKGLVAATLLLFGATACADLEVQNLNAPDASRALQSAGDVESLVAGAFETWHDAQYDYSGVSLFLSNASFQHTAPWANGGMEFYARIPRNPIVNDPAHVEYGQISSAWDINYSALSAVADGLRAVENEESGVADALGTDRTNRLKAYGRFVQGLALGSIALLYDQAFIVDETTDLTQPQDPVDYSTAMEAALGYLDDAIALAEAGFTEAIPATWMSVEVDDAQLARLAYTHKARFRANVARTPAERDAVDWDAVIADAEDGITEDWIMDMDYYAGWYAESLDYGTYPGWAEMNYFVSGMADQDGNYQRWLDLLPTNDAKIPNPESGDIAIVTPDTRFPQGADIATQMDNPGTLFAIPDGLTGEYAGTDRAWGIANVWKRPDRGSWRWSWYWHIDTEEYTYFVNFEWPQASIAEMDLLRAEGMYRNGDMAGAAAIVDSYRAANGLNEFGGTYTSAANTSCVPRLPNETCGDLWEALKWEKRMETHFKGLYMNSWWLDGRGWGDLFVGSPLQLPMPCREAQTLGLLPCYTFGTGGEYTAPVSTYAYPDETQ